jgi:hypothetical protein
MKSLAKNENINTNNSSQLVPKFYKSFIQINKSNVKNKQTVVPALPRPVSSAAMPFIWNNPQVQLPLSLKPKVNNS